MSKDTVNSAVVTYRFKKSAESVYDAWINPDKVMQWMFPEGNIVRAEIDARVGGTFSFVDLRDGEEVDHQGEYIEINPPHRLVFTWGIPEIAAEFDRIFIDIAPTETGCDLTLVHELHPQWAEYVTEAENAWKTMVEAMDAALNHKP